MSVEAPKVDTKANLVRWTMRGWAAVSGAITGVGVLFPPLFFVGAGLGAVPLLVKGAYKLGEKWAEDDQKLLTVTHQQNAQQEAFLQKMKDAHARGTSLYAEVTSAFAGTATGSDHCDEHHFQ